MTVRTDTIVGFTAGAWDLLHAGHMLLFREAKDNCHHLIVALHRDPSIERPQKNKPVLSVDERRILLQGCRYVDQIVEYDTEDELIQLLMTLKPQVRFLGDDYVDKHFTGKHLDIPVHYVDRSHGYSSTTVRKRVTEGSVPQTHMQRRVEA
jgi:glycerol-3-phosphate cytidylyltransferase